MYTTNAHKRALIALSAALAALALAVAILGHQSVPAPTIATAGTEASPPAPMASGKTGMPVASVPVIRRKPAGSERPHGGARVFNGRMLVAYYGTAGTGALGVLGESSPAQAIRRTRRAARPFSRPGKPAVPVMELIVSVADAHPGPDGDYSHDIARESVRQYVRAARRHQVMLILDLQTGRSDFLKVAKRWAWALKDPRVGVALDPEWRMKRGEVPGRRIGSVTADEINRTSRWVERLVRRERLPQKIFMLHQFRRDMISGVEHVKARRHLAMVQHVDGFGTPHQKLATYHHVAQPRQFAMGFKLFYDEDTRLMSAAKVKRIRPRVEFVSFQ